MSDQKKAPVLISVIGCKDIKLTNNTVYGDASLAEIVNSHGVELAGNKQYSSEFYSKISEFKLKLSRLEFEQKKDLLDLVEVVEKNPSESGLRKIKEILENIKLPAEYGVLLAHITQLFAH